MKKTYKYLIMCIIFILCTSFTYVDSYATKEVYNTRNAGSVPMNKEWKIKFSRAVDKSSLNSNIKIVDKYNRKVLIKIEVDRKDKKIVYVKPVKNYVQGKSYKLVISPKIKGKDGTELKDGKIIEFTVKNVYAGLPYEDGLLVIGNNAYSIDYLAKNSQVKNDILKGDHSVFYVYKQSTDKVKDILGDKFIDGNSKPPEYDIKKPIEYTDAEGDKTLYAWNKDKALFEVVNPSIDVKISVNLNSNADKVIMMNVEKANWIDGAWDEEEDEWIDRSCYFKLDNSNLYYKIGELDKIDEPDKMGEAAIFTSTDSREGITIYSSSMTKLGEGTINSFFEGKYNIKIKLFPKSGEGNSAGNIVNNGYVSADENGYIYYNNTGDGNKLYKYDTNGIFHSVISDDFAQYINVADEWVYYSNYSDKAKLYRIKSDGSSKQKLNDEYSAFVTIVGDYIYYSNYTKNGSITRIKKDGSDATDPDNNGEKHGIPLSDQVKDEAFFLNYVGEWIYYSNINDHYKLYAVNTNGTYRKKLSDEGTSSIQVVDDWVYYTNNKGELRKVKNDGSKETQDLNSVVSKFDRGYFFNVVDEWIYYSNAKDSNRLYKIKTDGTENTRLTFEPVTYISIVYNTIYFVSKGNMYTVPIDTNGRIRPIAVKKVESDKKVVQVDDVEVSVPFNEVNDKIETLEERYLPAKVPGIMSDNRLQQFVVQWDKKNIVIRNGVRTYNGKLIGYDQYIELTMKIPSEMLNHTTTIAIYNNAGTRNGHIEVYSDPVVGDDKNIPPKLRVGDELKLYEDKHLTKLLRTTTVSRQGIHNKGLFQNVELDRYGTKEYYITIRRQGKTESEGTKFTVGDAPVITKTIHKLVIDKDDEGLGVDGRDFSIEEMNLTKSKDVHESYIYLTPSGAQLKMQSDGISKFDNERIIEKEDIEDIEWEGKEYQKIEDYDEDGKPIYYDDRPLMNRDSFSNILTERKYDLYLVSMYSDVAAPDSVGSTPTIEGWAVSDPATIDIKSEGLPNAPDIQTETKRFGDEIALKFTPKEGETAYLVPIWNKEFEETNGYGKYIKQIIKEEDIQGVKQEVKKQLYEIGEDDVDDAGDGEWVYYISHMDSSEEETETWLEVAKTWIGSKEDWPFGDSHEDDNKNWEFAVDNGFITKLEGDGKTRVMQVPKGILYTPPNQWEELGLSDDDKCIANDELYAPNLQYKLVVVNNVGVSSISNGTLTVDNRPPTIKLKYFNDDTRPWKIVPDDIAYGEKLPILTNDSDAFLYFVGGIHDIESFAALERAVAEGKATKFPLSIDTRSVVDTGLLKPNEDQNAFYYLIVADKIGNFTKIPMDSIKIYADITLLDLYVSDAEKALKSLPNEGIILESDRQDLQQLVDEAKEMISKIRDSFESDNPSQEKINDKAEELKTKLKDIGVIHWRNIADEENEIITTITNYLNKLRYANTPYREIEETERDYNNKDYYVVNDDIFLERSFEYKEKDKDEKYLYKYKIEWEIEADNIDNAKKYLDLNLFENEIDKIGKVTRPGLGEVNPEDVKLDLIAKIINVEMTDSGVEQEKEVYRTKIPMIIKARGFTTSVTGTASKKAMIIPNGVSNSPGDVIVTIQQGEGSDEYKDSYTTDGVTYKFKQPRSINGNIELELDISGSDDDPDNVLHDELKIQIKIYGDSGSRADENAVIVDNQIKVMIENDGMNAVVGNQ